MKRRNPGPTPTGHVTPDRVSDFGGLSLQAADADPGLSDPGIIEARSRG